MHFWGYLCISFGFESMLKSNMTSDELKFKGPLHRYSSCYNKLFTFCELKMNWIKMFNLLDSHCKVISCQSIVVWSNIKSFRKLKNLMEMFTINIFLIIISMHFSTAKENTLYKCSSKVIMLKYT